MYILHLVFLPRINKVISTFVDGWNIHPLRTEGYKSPEYPWSNGMIDLRNRHLVQVAEVAEEMVDQAEMEWFGFDPETPTPNDSIKQVDLEDIPLPFSNEELLQLRAIDFLADSSTMELISICKYSTISWCLVVVNYFLKGIYW